MLLNRAGEEFTQGSPVTVHKEVDGEVVETKEVKYSKVSLGRMLTSACLKNVGDVDEKTIMKKYNLFLKLEDKDEAEVTEEELKYIRQLACESFDIFFAGQILTLIK